MRYVRSILTLLILLGVVLSTHGGLLAHSVFHLRQEFLAEHHCENRHDPESDCNGYCILKKHVAERAHEDAHSNLTFSHVMFYLAPETASPSVSGTPEPPLHSHYVPPSADAYVGDLDPPPRFA